MGTEIKEIPQQVIDSFYYDETSPSCLRWRVSPSKWLKIKCGDVAGCMTKQGYWTVKCHKSLYKVHRIVYALLHGCIDNTLVVDHKNKDKSDNTVENLRVVDWDENSRNRSKPFNNSSGITGVSKQKGRGDYWSWVAVCKFPDGRLIRRTFGIPAYGEQRAFDMAVEARETLLKEVRFMENSYTENHGK